MESEWLIELEEADVTRLDDAETVLVRGVHWRIARGDFWVVGSPPGAGRTSLLATAAGLNRAGGGGVRIFGRSLEEASEAEQIRWRQRIGFVFEQGGRLLGQLTVAQNVALALRYHTTMSEDEIGAAVIQWLERIGLRAHADVFPSRLTPIWQQRVALARALIQPKEVLFVDNPPAGRTRDAAWWRHQLCEQAADGVTVVVGSNDFSQWLDTARQFAVVQDGQFRVIGGREQVRVAAGAEWREYIMVD
ncbi:MAG: ATP-binding cassette domain-containing protein [Verrucomicrobiae bacterium]|nr:ATP-binding cassette domain-containing protein [Verrucomicrobiae bacterium]